MVPNFSLIEWCRTFKPFMPRLSVKDRSKLQAIGILKQTVPFPILEIPCNKLLDHTAVPYISKSHVHYKALYSEYDSEAIFLDFFKTFQPKNLYDIFPIDNKDSKSELLKMSPHYFANSMPWSLNERLPLASVESNISSYHFGPANEEFNRRDFRRLQKASRMIQKNGYKPFSYPDGFIRGFIIEDGKNYCFVVTSGKHRATTTAMHVQRIRVRLEWNHFLGVVSLDDAANLPQVVSGLFDVNTSKSLIMHYIKKAS